MIPVLSVDLMKRSDVRACETIPARDLMERAGEGMLRALLDRMHPLPSAAVICGSGSNAGDGFVLARLLREAGIPVAVFTLSDRRTEAGAYHASLCAEAGVPIRPFERGTDLTSFAAVADCILGIGFTGRLRAPASDAVRAVNRAGEAGAFVLSADINSGLNGDNGLAFPAEDAEPGEGPLCVKSDLTVSAGGFKPGHFLSMAKDVMKAKINLDIGIEPIAEPYHLMEASDAAAAFPHRLNFSNKADYGYCALIGGSDRYSGAVRLASLSCAAVRSGAGVVKTAAPASLCPLIAPSILEATLFPMPETEGRLRFDPDALGELTRGIRSAAFGMGVGPGPETEKIAAWLLAHFEGALVIDADGLNALRRMEGDPLGESRARVILTPHVLEFARLLHLPRETGVAEVLSDPVGLAERYARDHGVTLLLKGPATVVTDGKRTILTDRGCPGMATAGSGDVLSGVLAAVCGFCPDPVTAAAASAWVCGAAGELAEEDMGPVSMAAGDTVGKLPAVIRSLTLPNARVSAR